MNAVDCVLRLSSGLLTPVIAAIALYIAFQQYKTAHDKLRLDLYERRFRVYRGLMDLLAVIARDEPVSQEDLDNFYRETDQKRFLFKNELREYLTLVREKAVRLRQLKRNLDPTVSLPDDRRTRAIDEETELLGWFDKEFEEVETRFEPYLGFYQRLWGWF
jgi:hypothetical protein